MARREPAAAESPLGALARAAAGGDSAATARLLEDIRPRIARVVRVIVGPNSPDFDDILQQALIEIVQALPRFRGECEPTSYATRIAVRTALTARRRARARAVHHADVDDVSEVPSSDAQPPDGLARERRRSLLCELLDDLPPPQADALAFRFILGCSLAEIAAATGVPVNTVRSRVRLAKEALRRRIAASSTLAEALEVIE